MKNFAYDKVVIWGYPLYSHTASYGWEAYQKAFSYLGYDVYWFHDEDFPEDFDFSNTMFLCEGFADKKLPLNDSSCYFVWYCPDPAKYINAGVKKFVDVRMPVDNHKDHIHDYSVSSLDTISIGPSCLMEKKKDQKVTISNQYVSYEIDDFDRLYINWATNLLPHEILESDIYLERDEKKIYFLGSISNAGQHENFSNFKPFVEECQKLGIEFYHNDPWRSPVTTDKLVETTKKSYLGVEIRGPEHVRTNMVPERIFKNISFGHLGMTNSKAVYKELEGNCIFNPKTDELLHNCISNRENWQMIKNAQKLVKEKHTYVNRIKSLVDIANENY
tara:strand:- start:12698 stop:13693 length:996 start_codon:yes stop_codon:yes gene_type:complete